MEYIFGWILYISGMCGNVMWHLLRSHVNVDVCAIAVSKCWNGAGSNHTLECSVGLPFTFGGAHKKGAANKVCFGHQQIRT